MSTEELPGGTSCTGEEPESVLRGIVDGALIASRNVPDARESADASWVPSKRLSDLITGGLTALYEASGKGQDVRQWLGDVLCLPADQVIQNAPGLIAGLLDDTADDPTVDFDVPPMTDEEDTADAERALQAADAFGLVPDGLPMEAAP